VRGVYYAIQRARLPEHYHCGVRRLFPWSAREVWQVMQQHGVNGPLVLGEGVFRCGFFCTTEDPGITWWLLGFYDRVFYEVSTEPADRQQDSTRNPAGRVVN
jgi:3'-phosphoadenosine 5'-phosphosulfate sulfotransferase (PAPS reductase)/FAD synthetase